MGTILDILIGVAVVLTLVSLWRGRKTMRRSQQVFAIGFVLLGVASLIFDQNSGIAYLVQLPLASALLIFSLVVGRRERCHRERLHAMQVSTKTKWIFGALGLGVTAALILIFNVGTTPVSIQYAGTTNGFVGITNASWTIFTVSNQTSRLLAYAGARLQRKTVKGWESDSEAVETAMGWRGDLTKFFHTGPNLKAHSTMQVFVAMPSTTNALRAELAFAEPFPRPPTWLPRFAQGWWHTRGMRIRCTTPPIRKT